MGMMYVCVFYEAIKLITFCVCVVTLFSPRDPSQKGHLLQNQTLERNYPYLVYVTAIPKNNYIKYENIFNLLLIKKIADAYLDPLALNK